MVHSVRVLLILLLVAVTTDIRPTRAGEGLPPARQIPGINAEDRFPGGCVDCHINMPERKMDERLSTRMGRWVEGVEPQLLARIEPSAPAGAGLKGKHPVATASLKNIPAGCISCHGKSSTAAPSFAAMIHLLHLGGEGNHFITLFQGECALCHKFDARNGTWSVPSGPEK
jgi:hypothetical protein